MPILTGREPDATEEQADLGRDRSEELSSIVNKFILRRTNKLLSDHLPPKVNPQRSIFQCQSKCRFMDIRLPWSCSIASIGPVPCVVTALHMPFFGCCCCGSGSCQPLSVVASQSLEICCLTRSKISVQSLSPLLLIEMIVLQIVEVVCCRLTHLQQSLYHRFLESTAAKRVLNGKSSRVLAAITALKKLCNHPKLLRDATKDENDEVAGLEVSGVGRAGVSEVASRGLLLHISQHRMDAVHREPQNVDNTYAGHFLHGGNVGVQPKCMVVQNKKITLTECQDKSCFALETGMAALSCWDFPHRR